MKALKKIIAISLFVSLSMVISSCDDKSETVSSGQPTVTQITTLGERLNALTHTEYGSWIIIHGNFLSTTSKVSFNGQTVSKEDFFADENSITIKIPQTLPDPQNNPITITTAFGEITHPFRILQPKPEIKQINPSIGNPGEIITIEGLHFNGVSKVMIGDESAEIVSNTLTEIKVKITPAAFGVITVTTPSGTASSTGKFGIKHLVFTEGLHTNWSNTSYTGTFNLNNTTKAKRGQASLSAVYGGWGAIRLAYSATLAFNNFTAVKFSIFAEEANKGTKVRIYLNNSSATGSYTITIDKVNEWVEYQIPLTSFGNLTNITSLLFQEYSGQNKANIQNSVFYFDDIGFL